MPISPRPTVFYFLLRGGQSSAKSLIRKIQWEEPSEAGTVSMIRTSENSLSEWSKRDEKISRPSKGVGHVPPIANTVFSLRELTEKRIRRGTHSALESMCCGSFNERTNACAKRKPVPEQILLKRVCRSNRETAQCPSFFLSLCLPPRLFILSLYRRQFLVQTANADQEEQNRD